jgi:hypothetical protein
MVEALQVTAQVTEQVLEVEALEQLAKVQLNYTLVAKVAKAFK